ncbi:hypothetical protein [Aquimarina sp. 2201CG5-10]|uniref:hypothetical protein n=1 Tax=Aquimarina callyspongiae TaxID=3098150 RepID=UPI002AB3C146|nr:hypothetical protein [Aquimarina sp. 2201CG5-10]MDY8135454.1 hypothetical protein [Aquimarina sp. 2201CG5-10]
MKKIFTAILLLIELLTFGQENNLEQIDNEVNSINSNSELSINEFDWVELTGIATDGGGILKIWRNNKDIRKIVQEIGISYGRTRTTIYLTNGIPIKVIETEENFERTNNGLNYSKLDQVYKEEFFVFNWEIGEGKIKKTGKRVISEGGCSHFDYEPIIERAQKAITE